MGKQLNKCLKFHYLKVEISADRNLTQKVRNQAKKALCVAGCLWNVFWRNVYMKAKLDL